MNPIPRVQAYHSPEGNTLAEMISRLNVVSDRVPIPSHIGVVVFDEKLAREGLEPYLDVMHRSRYIREDVMILVARGVSASSVLKVLYPRGGVSSTKVRLQIESLKKMGGGAAISRMADFTQELLIQGREPLLTAVTLAGQPEKGESLDNTKSDVPSVVVEVAGTAVLPEDKLAGFLPGEEAQWVEMARGQMKVTTLSVPLEQKGMYTAVRLYNIQSKRSVSFRKGVPQLRMYVEADGMIVGLQQDMPLNKVSGYLQIDRLTQDYSREHIKAATRRCRRSSARTYSGSGNGCIDGITRNSRRWPRNGTGSSPKRRLTCRSRSISDVPS